MVHSTSKAIDLTFTVIQFAAVLSAKKKASTHKKKHVQSCNKKFTSTCILEVTTNNSGQRNTLKGPYSSSINFLKVSEKKMHYVV